jgi:intraflagellar transport protein 80
MLYENIERADFEKAIRLCRFVKEHTLWACLAAMSIYCRELNTAEIALAAIDEADKVQFINKIKELPSEPARNAALSLYCHKINEAEQILLQAKLYYRAIKMNVKLFRWSRALDIALNNKVHLDTVVAYRKRYMTQNTKEEKDARFIQHTTEVGEINWESIKEKIRGDKEKEEAM